MEFPDLTPEATKVHLAQLNDYKEDPLDNSVEALSTTGSAGKSDRSLAADMSFH